MGLIDLVTCRCGVAQQIAEHILPELSARFVDICTASKKAVATCWEYKCLINSAMDILQPEKDMQFKKKKKACGVSLKLFHCFYCSARWKCMWNPW